MIALYMAGKSKAATFRDLNLFKVNKMFACRAINRYNKTRSIAKRYGGALKGKLQQHVKV